MAGKLVGLSKGQVRTLGDTGTVSHDGSIIIGNADTDVIEVNAEFTSSLVPNAAFTYNLGSVAKPWSQVFAGAVTSTSGFTHVGSNGNAVMLVFPENPGGQQIYVYQDVSNYQYPNNTVTVAIEGATPSLLPYGKNGTLSATDGNPVDFEFTTVNGAQNGVGYRMPTPGVVTNFSFQCLVSSTSQAQLEIVLTKNGTETSHKITLYPSSTGALGESLDLYANPLSFQQNDTLGLQYKSSLSSGAGGSLSTSDHSCLIRILH